MRYYKWVGLITTLLILILSNFSPQLQAEPKQQHKTTICHLPPGNPDNEQTLDVASAAVDAHLAHGDRTGACDGGGDGTQQQLFLDVTANQTYGVIGTLFELSAKSASADTIGADYQWSTSDNRSFSGETIALTFAQVGVYEITLTETLANGDVSTAEVGVMIHDLNDPTPDILGLPNLMGDLNNDGRITLLDAYQAAKFTGRVEQMSPELQRVADMDFSSSVSFGDVQLIAGAVLGGANLPDQLLSDQGSPGKMVTIVSPLLLNPLDVIEIGIGSSRQQPNRPIMGYVSFIMPFTGDGSIPGLQNIQLFVNGIESASYEFTVTQPHALPLDPVADLSSFLNDVQSLLAVNEQLIAEQLDSVQLSAEDREVLIASAAAGREAAETSITELQRLLTDPNASTLAQTILLAANANGLVESRQQLQAFMTAIAGVENLSEITAEQIALISPDEVCDNLIPAVCALKKAADIVNGTSGAVSTACDILLAAALAAVIVPADGPLVDLALIGAWASACAPLEFALDTAAVITSLISNIDMNVKLTASTTSPDAGEPVILKSTLTVFGLDYICRIGAGKGTSAIVKELSQRIVNRLIMRKVTIRAMVKIFTELGESYLQKFLGLLESYAGKAITSTGIDKAIVAFAAPYCANILDADLVMNAERVLTGPTPAEGTLTFLGDGTAEYMCPEMPDSNDPITVAFEAKKDICGTTKSQMVSVGCATRDVTFTMGDNGSANDDIYEIVLDGKSILTTNTPVRAASVVVPLVVGSTHQVQMLGRAAPDGIGTYYIRFSGATVTSGDALSGFDLVPGAVKNYTIKVLP